MKHKLLGVDAPCECDREGECFICDGDISYCVICHGAESSLPTDCPEKKMTDNQQIGVTNGDDYKDGNWNLIYIHN